MIKRLLTILIGALIMSLPVIVTSATSSGTTYATAQQFEHGLMIYRADTGTIYVLRDGGFAQTFDSQIYGEWSDNTQAAPNGFYTPINGFGRIWTERKAIRDALGWATLPEIGFNMRVATDDGGAVYLQQLDNTIYRILGSEWRTVDAMPDNSDTAVDPYVNLRIDPADISPGESYTVTWQAGGEGVQYVSLRVYDTLGSRHANAFEARQPLSGGVMFQAPATLYGNLRVEAIGTGQVNQSNLANVQEDKVMTAQEVNISGNDNNVTVRGVYQPFENGFMLWRADSGEVRMFYDAADGRQPSAAFSEADYSTWAAFSGSVPDGFVAPRNAFGRVWARDITMGSDDALLRELIGYPTEDEREISLTIAQDDNTRVYRFSGQTILIENFFAIEAKFWRQG